MGKSLLKNRIKKILNEALTPDQVSQVEDKYNSIYSGMLKGNKKKLMKYVDPKFKRPNPDAMAMGRAINLVKKDSDKEEVNEAKYPEYTVTKDDWKKSKYPFEKLKNSEFKIKIAGEGDDRKYLFFWKEDGEGDWEAGNMKRQLRSALTAIAKRKLPIKEDEMINEYSFEWNKARAGRIMKDLFGPDFEFDYTYKLEGDRIIIHPEGYNDDGTLFDMKDVHKEKIIRTFRDKMPSANAKPNMGGGITVHLKESVNENEMSTKIPFVIDLGEDISRANYKKVMLKLDSMGYKGWYQLAMNVRDKLLVNRLGRKPIIHFYPGFRYLILGPIGEIPEKEINHNNELIEKYSSLEVVPFEDFLNESVNENEAPVKVGDKLKMAYQGSTVRDKTGVVTSVSDDMAQVDFGGGDVYGILFSRIKGNEIMKEDLIKEASWDEIAMEKYGVKYDKLNHLEQEWVRDKMDKDRGVMEEVTSVNERLSSMVREVYSEKQRKWACAQDDPKFDEMCKDTAISKKKLEEYFMLMNPSKKRGGGKNYPSEYLGVLAHYQHSVLKIPRHKRAKATVGADMHDRYGQEVWDIISNNYPTLGLDPTPPSNWKDTARLLAGKFKEADLSYYRDLKKPFLNEGKTSTVSKSRAKSSLKQMLKGKRDDGMGKPTLKAVLAIDKDGKETEVKKLEDFDKFEKGTKFALKETTMNNDRLTELIKAALKGPVKEDKSKLEEIGKVKWQGELLDKLKIYFKIAYETGLESLGSYDDFEEEFWNRNKDDMLYKLHNLNESYMMDTDSNANTAVLQVLSILKHADIDGETMQYILEELGMDEQMWKQLNVKYGTP